MNESLFEKLKAYGESDFYPFHMPGHKRNPASGPMASFYAWDITEIDGFDNLHQPEGILKQAQERAAALYGADETCFLINGSTAGILSAVAAVAKPGSRLLIARNCHKAVYHAAFLNHLKLEYLYPELLADYGIAGGISKEQVKRKLQQLGREEAGAGEPGTAPVAAIVITSPTYDGILSEVAAIAEVAHGYGIPLIVDQAHGAHLGFHPAFPESAVKQGADLIIHSVHKTLPAPTQTALIHRCGSLVDPERLHRYLRIYQSSSPSYLLMAGIDCALQLMAEEGRERLEDLLRLRRQLMEQTAGLKRIRIYPALSSQQKEPWQQGSCEPGKLLISVRGTGRTGQWLYDRLRKEDHLQLEMCGADYAVAILSLMDTEEGIQRLAAALCRLDAQMESDTRKEESGEDAFLLPTVYWPVPEAALPVGEAWDTGGESIPLLQAEGRILGEFVNLYPPGIPLLVPGERMDREMLQYLRSCLYHGYTLQGIRVDSQGEAWIYVLPQEPVSPFE